MKTKKELRAFFRTQRNKNVTDAANDNIVKLIQTLSIFERATTIGYYIPFEKEINIDNFLKQSSKIIAYPYVENKQMYFLKNVHEFQDSRMGVTMPVQDIMTEIIEPDILLIPIIAINNLGFRLGYGGGYYDRYLSEHNSISIAIGTEKQIIETDFQDEWDQQMNYLVTEKQIYKY